MKNMTIFHLSQIAVGVVVGLMLGISVASAAEEAPAWLWSARAPEINQTTAALATGHAARALRFAESAQAGALPAPERLVAAHNLCLALIATRSSKADSACRDAVRTILPDDDDRAQFVRGAWTVGITNSENDAARLTHLVRANIARAYGVRIVDRLSEEPW